MALHLTYVGCEGVLVRSRGGSVLIDGLFGREAEPFGVPRASDMESLRHARPPFQEIDVVLATHDHGDHFDPGAVAAYLRASPRTRFVSTPQAVGALRSVADDDVVSRATAVEPVDGARRALDIGPIRVEAFGLSHGRVHYAGVQHLAWMATLDGRSVLHLGDGIIDEKSLRAAGVLDGSIDVGVFPFWFLTYPFGKRLVEKTFRPRSIFAVHIRVAEREQVVSEIGAWIDATPLIEPLSRYEIGRDGRVSREE